MSPQPEAAVESVTWLPIRWNDELLDVLRDLPEDVRRQHVEAAKRMTPILGGAK